jgi:serine/threonine-protein kinase RsbW
MTDEAFTIDIVSDYAEVRRVGEWLADIGQGRIDEAVLDELQLVVAEAVNNIIRHAYREQPGRPISVRLELTAAGITLVFRDSGQAPPPGFPQSRIGSLEVDPTDLAALGESGRGLAIIMSCVDRMDYARNGSANEMRLSLRRDSRQP